MYIFKAKLEDTELNIIRRFQVPDDFGVYELGCTVVALFGFQGSILSSSTQWAQVRR